jgi:murein L,D-transpeptidase YafK
MLPPKLKIPKVHKKTPEGLYLKVGIGVIAVLVILNIVFATLLIRENKSNGNALKILQGINKSLVLLQDSLARLDMQKAFVHLADARNQIAAVLPPSSAEPPAKAAAEPKPAAPQAAKVVAEPKPAAPAVTAPVVKPADFKIPAGETPLPLVSAVAGEYMLICEKENKLLHLFKFQDERFVLVKSYPCIIGANGSDKKKAGDFATPKGSYFTLRYIPKNALTEIYGEGAFVLNYPNFLDRKDSKKGAGIWIHGHVPGKVIGTGDLVNTKGCIAVSNDIIRELKGLLRPSGTHVSIVDRIKFVKEASRKESLQDVRGFMDAWRKGWESGDTEKYLSHYSRDFVNSEGMNFEAFKKHKERVNRGKKFIRVKVDQLAVVFFQEKEGQVAVARFVQKYRSNNFDSDSGKLFYLKKERGGWAIFGESAF